MGSTPPDPMPPPMAFASVCAEFGHRFVGECACPGCSVRAQSRPLVAALKARSARVCYSLRSRGSDRLKGLGWRENTPSSRVYPLIVEDWAKSQGVA